MSLTNLEYGSLASSETLNNNFNYLDNRITTLSNSTVSGMATVNSNIASINASLSSLNDSVDDIITKYNTACTSGGLYITRYVNETSWYTAYFSDYAKTDRVWLEQGFMTPLKSWNNNESTVYNLLQPFSDTNYTVIATSTNMSLSGNISSGNVAVEDVSTTQVTIGNDGAGTFAVRVFACGK